MNNYLIEGLSGTGKTAVGKELTKRGIQVIDADEEFGYYGDPNTGLPIKNKSQLNWLWDKNKVDHALKNEGVTFVCGGAMNQGEFANYFQKVFTLFVDNQTLKQRLLNRIGNDFGKKPEDLERQLEWNKGTVSYSKQRNTILVDATKTIDEVVNEILRQIDF